MFALVLVKPLYKCITVFFVLQQPQRNLFCQNSTTQDVAHHIFHGNVPTGCDFQGVYGQVWAWADTQSLLRPVDIGPEKEFPSRSGTDGARWGSAEMEQEIAVLRKVSFECLSGATGEWAAGLCLAPILLWLRMWRAILIQGSTSPLWFQRY